jgi:hypothetical protein
MKKIEPKRKTRVATERMPSVMTEKALCKFAGASISEIDAWVKQGLPFSYQTSLQSGKKVRVFSREEFISWCVGEWLNNH